MKKDNYLLSSAFDSMHSMLIAMHHLFGLYRNPNRKDKNARNKNLLNIVTWAMKWMWSSTFYPMQLDGIGVQYILCMLQPPPIKTAAYPIHSAKTGCKRTAPGETEPLTAGGGGDGSELWKMRRAVRICHPHLPSTARQEGTIELITSILIIFIQARGCDKVISNLEDR